MPYTTKVSVLHQFHLKDTMQEQRVEDCGAEQKMGTVCTKDAVSSEMVPLWPKIRPQIKTSKPFRKL